MKAFNEPAEQAEASSLGWSEAEPQDNEGKRIKRAKRAKAYERCDLLTASSCRPLRGLFACTLTILGFRFAPPQALCSRRASRAQCNVSQRREYALRRVSIPERNANRFS